MPRRTKRRTKPRVPNEQAIEDSPVIVDLLENLRYNQPNRARVILAMGGEQALLDHLRDRMNRMIALEATLSRRKNLLPGEASLEAARQVAGEAEHEPRPLSQRDQRVFEKVREGLESGQYQKTYPTATIASRTQTPSPQGE